MVVQFTRSSPIGRPLECLLISFEQLTMLLLAKRPPHNLCLLNTMTVRKTVCRSIPDAAFRGSQNGLYGLFFDLTDNEPAESLERLLQISPECYFYSAVINSRPFQSYRYSMFALILKFLIAKSKSISS